VLADRTKVDHTGAAVAQVVVLAPIAVAMLRAWRTAQIEERCLWPWRKEHNDLVFTKEDSAPLKPDWLNRRFKLLARQAGLPDGVRVYDLRHGWATAALRAGVHPKLVQEVMRHSSYSTTADTYTHVMPADRSLVAEPRSQRRPRGEEALGVQRDRFQTLNKGSAERGRSGPWAIDQASWIGQGVPGCGAGPGGSVGWRR
jgi:site-specific recombinase XerC